MYHPHWHRPAWGSVWVCIEKFKYMCVCVRMYTFIYIHIYTLVQIIKIGISWHEALSVCVSVCQSLYLSVCLSVCWTEWMIHISKCLCEYKCISFRQTHMHNTQPYEWVTSHILRTLRQASAGMRLGMCAIHNIYTYIYVYIYIYISTYIYIYIHTCTYVYICVCVCVRARARVYTPPFGERALTRKGGRGGHIYLYIYIDIEQ